ncbi:prolipoprotein diacylglyceryl transferase [Candidatus Babeliales bacterium]|nr:prolipoprotein diacylglyceryl transferase [Candidatus Babeliales bacterium]
MFPRILHIYGPLWVNGYGLMIGLGLLIFVFLTYNHPWRKRLLGGEEYLNILFIGFLAAVFGGRLLFVAFNWQSFDQNYFEICYPWVGGFSLFGSILVVLFVVSLYLKKLSVRVLPFFDLIALHIPLLQAVARIGCFLAGCCYGVCAPSNLPWAVTFTNPYGLAPLGIALHPAQLYSVGASLLIFIFLQILVKKRTFYHGAILFVYLMFESVARFVVDFYRADRDLLDQAKLAFLPEAISLQQLLVSIVFFGSLAALIALTMKSRKR